MSGAELSSAESEGPKRRRRNGPPPYLYGIFNEILLTSALLASFSRCCCQCCPSPVEAQEESSVEGVNCGGEKKKYEVKKKNKIEKK